MNPAQTLPRFLLPRLSWTGPLSVPTSTATAIPSASTIVLRQARDAFKGAGWQPAPRRSLHTAGVSPARKTDSLRGGNSRSLPAAKHRPNSSIVVRNPALRRAFHASATRSRDHHFDTLRFVQRLQEEGFTEEQSVAMMKVLNDVIEERSANFPPFSPPTHG